MTDYQYEHKEVKTCEDNLKDNTQGSLCVSNVLNGNYYTCILMNFPSYQKEKQMFYENFNILVFSE